MNCRNCRCIVEEARFSTTPSGYVHVCTTDHYEFDKTCAYCGVLVVAL